MGPLTGTSPRSNASGGEYRFWYVESCLRLEVSGKLRSSSQRFSRPVSTPCPASPSLQSGERQQDSEVDQELVLRDSVREGFDSDPKRMVRCEPCPDVALQTGDIAEMTRPAFYAGKTPAHVPSERIAASILSAALPIRGGTITRTPSKRTETRVPRVIPEPSHHIRGRIT